MGKRLARWWWRGTVRHRWGRVFFGTLYSAIGVYALAAGHWSIIGYLWLAAGVLSLCIGLAGWTYRRRYPPERQTSRLDNLFG